MFDPSTSKSPMEAYGEVLRFAKKRGEASVMLALHAAVPQSLRPDLLHLLKLNFVPEAANNDAVEADVLLSLCEDVGHGYFQFDPQIRSVLLDNLAANYAHEPVSRVYRVASFLLAYISHFEGTGYRSQDLIFQDYLEVQRWVALAFIDPKDAAKQMAEALDQADTRRDFATRVRLGGLAFALSTPLVQYRQLLNYAAGLLALETGELTKANDLFEGLEEEDLEVGNIRLRPVPQVLDEWKFRHPGNMEGQSRWPQLNEFANAYLAETPYELEEEREEIKTLLEQRGYYILPDAPLPLDVGSLQTTVRKSLERCTVSIHLIGKTYGISPEGGETQSMSRLQYDLAGARLTNPDFYRVVWLPEGIESDDIHQREFIEHIEKTAGNQQQTHLLRSTLDDLKTFVITNITEDREGGNCG